MKHLKVLCVNCSHYKECSQRTRMYVNYCGTRMKYLKSKIEKAFAECRSHQGLIYKYDVLSPLKELQKASQSDLI